MIKTSNDKIYIVAYHYVREIKKSKYPNLKGLEFSDFKKQIEFFEKNFNIISHNDFIEIMVTKKIPKKKSIMLTFDDGYKDHFKYVYPYLKKRKILGNFYPPVMCIKNKRVLDVNKIHFILEKEKNRDKILNLIIYYTKKYSGIDLNNARLNKIDTKNRFDDKKTIIIKRLLQNYLPIKLRKRIVNRIFEKIVNLSEEEFSKKLYMNEKNVKELYKNKFTIGSHGYDHFWWGKISKDEQEKEIKKSINYFKKIDVYNNSFSVCFPYGSFNTYTKDLLKKYKIKYALTTKTGNIIKSNIKNNLELPRMDTNDFR